MMMMMPIVVVAGRCWCSVLTAAVAVTAVNVTDGTLCIRHIVRHQIGHVCCVCVSSILCQPIEQALHLHFPLSAAHCVPSLPLPLPFPLPFPLPLFLFLFLISCAAHGVDVSSLLLFILLSVPLYSFISRPGNCRSHIYKANCEAQKMPQPQSPSQSVSDSVSESELESELELESPGPIPSPSHVAIICNFHRSPATNRPAKCQENSYQTDHKKYASAIFPELTCLDCGCLKFANALVNLIGSY